MICRYCGSNQPAGASVCSECGANLAAESRIYDTQQPAVNDTNTYGNNMGYPQFDPNFTPPKTSKTTKIISAIVVVLIIIVATFIVRSLTSDVYGVKHGHPNLYPNTTWEDALKDVCKNHKWKSYKEDGYRYVKYTGKVKSDGDKLEIIFRVEDDSKTFTIDSIKKGGEEESPLIVKDIFDGKL